MIALLSSIVLLSCNNLPIEQKVSHAVQLDITCFTGTLCNYNLQIVQHYI